MRKEILKGRDLLRVIATSAVMMCSALGSNTTLAQTAPATKQVAIPNPEGRALPEIQARRQVLFQRMVNRPDDLDVAFE